jgi:glycosyltransferase involved in cell wall biosynthesis
MAKPMRLLWICGSRILGGAETTSLQLTGLLAARGHEVACLCRAGSEVERELSRSGMPHRSARIGGSLNAGTLAAIVSAMRELRPQVLLVTTVDEWVWASLALPRRFGARLVLVRHMVLPLARRVQWLANRAADAVVAVSDAVRASLVHIDSSRLHVIRVPWRFAPRAAVAAPAERDEARRALGLPPGERLVGFFGGLAPEKGVLDVLEALHLAGGAHLLVCGPTGDEVRRGAFAERVASAGLADRVHVRGWLADIRAAATAADVVVLATRSAIGEASPLVLLEAMACGTPVVGTAVGGVPEVIGADGDGGRLAAADDPRDLGRVLGEVLADPRAAAEMAARALARLRDRFDPQTAADAYETLFRDLVGDRRKTGA